MTKMVSIISIQPFVNAGVFVEDVPAGEAPAEWTVDFPGLKGTARFKRVSKELELFDRSLTITIATDSAQVGFGIRWYFSCGACHQRSSMLLIEEGIGFCDPCFFDPIRPRKFTRKEIRMAKRNFRKTEDSCSVRKQGSSPSAKPILPKPLTAQRKRRPRQLPSATSNAGRSDPKSFEMVLNSSPDLVRSQPTIAAHYARPSSVGITA